MKDDRVVEFVRVWANGDLDRPIDFEKQFSTTNDFDYAVVGTYSGTISESRF